jgi:trimethyllysine dioxygenase
VPATPEETETLIRRIAPIRDTHCMSSPKKPVVWRETKLTIPDGGFWDFTSNMSHGDLAYSTEGLPAHTDTTYFTDPAGLQIFHMLSHPPPGEGGTSLLVDGFYAANLLRELSPTSYATLSRLRIPAHASGTPGTMLRPTISQPVFRHDENGELAQVRWNNEDRGVIGQGWSPEDVRAWYKAAKEYERLLRGEDTEYWVQLSPGTMVGKCRE